MKKTKKQELEQLKIQLARALADYDNLKKRTEKEKEELIRYSNQGLIERLLPSLLMLERANKHLQDSGLEMVISNLKQTLAQVGVVEINPTKGENFDESIHEATDVISGGKQGTVSEVIESGFTWEGGRLIKPAQVRVYGKAEVVNP